MAETARNLRVKNLVKATELKGDVLDMMKQTSDHCQSLKETASIAVKVRHAVLALDDFNEEAVAIPDVASTLVNIRQSHFLSVPINSSEEDL